jgi:ankyrin repeat protein
MCAAYAGHLEATRLLIETGADVNARRTNGATALVSAITGGGHLEVIKVLVENGADVNASVKGVRVLRFAEINRQAEVVRYLKEHGAK